MDLNRYVQDAAHRIVGRGDDNQGLYVQSLLTHTLNQVFQYKYRKTPFANGDLITIDTSADPGSDRVGWMMLGAAGKFATVADNGDDMPQIDLKGGYTSNKACTVAGFIEYTEQDLQAAAMQKLFNVATEKGTAARRAYDLTLDKYIAVENAEGDLPGLCKLPGRADVPVAAAWSTLTPVEICDAFAEIYGLVYDGTEGTIEPDTVVMPTSLRALFKRQNSVAANTSIEGFLMETYPEITKWIYNSVMNTAGRDGATCLLMYNREVESCGALVPEFMRPLQPQPHNLCWRIPFKSRYAGLRANYPGSVTTLYGV